MLDLAELIEEKDVEAEVAGHLGAELRQRLAAGDYDSNTTPRDLAAVLTRELEEVDRHFFVDWHPPGSPAEGFSYAMQAQKRGTIVGEITGGAANPGEGFSIGHGVTTVLCSTPSLAAVSPSNVTRRVASSAC